MASEPLLPSVPGPPQTVRPPGTLEWGASVHGSSACLEAMNQVSSSDLCTGATLPIAHTANQGTQADCSPPYPGGVQLNSYGFEDHNLHAYAESCTVLAASNHTSSWQPSGCSSQYPYAYDPHVQYNQCQSPDQFSWQSYHCHSAMQDPAAALGGGDPCNGWKGWASYSGARSIPPADGPGQQQYHMQGHGQVHTQDCSQGFTQDTQHQQQQHQGAYQPSSDDTSAKISDAEMSGGPSTMATIEPYDPTADADLLMEPRNAASIRAISPIGLTTQAVASTLGNHVPGNAASASAEHDGKCANSSVGALPLTTSLDLPLAAAVATPLDETPSAAALAADAAGDADTNTTAAAPAAPGVDLIVVWDLDETLIIFNSLMNGRFVQATASGASHTVAGAMASAVESDPTSDSVTNQGGVSGGIVKSELPNHASALGYELASMVFNFCDRYMAFLVLEDMHPASFLDLSSSAADATTLQSLGLPKAGHIAPFNWKDLEGIVEMYTGGLAGNMERLSEAWCRSRDSVIAQAEELTNGWVAAACQLLTGVTTAAVSRGTQEQPILAFRTVRHVLVSAGHFIATLGKLVLWGLSEHFDIRDVYSASGQSKLEIFRLLRERFGPTAAYTAVGDGREEERAAAVMGWGFVRVGLAAPPSAASTSQPLGQSQSQGEGGQDGNEPWRLPRPMQMIRPDDVLEAARRAYLGR